MNDLIIYFSYLFKGNNFEIYKALKNKIKVTEEEINDVKKMLEKNNIKTLTVFDDDYPFGLKQLRYSPFVLYYKGNIDLLKENIVCATGEYKTQTSINDLKRITNDLTKHSILLTNNYKNMDEEIIKIYKKHNKGIIYLLANGITYKDFKIDEKKDLIISQYPFDCHPKLYYFKERNVIASAISNCLIIFNSKKNSGLINLALCFANLGKEVYCYPGLDYDDGNTFLIKSGANLITHFQDINYY